MIAVNDAYRLFPDAAVLYACDSEWWDVHGGCPDFAGEKWSSHSVDAGGHNDKREVAKKYGLKLVEGRDRDGFSFDPACIHYGSNSGFQAVNLAILFGAKRIVLVGFDMRGVDRPSGTSSAIIRHRCAVTAATRASYEHLPVRRNRCRTISRSSTRRPAVR